MGDFRITIEGVGNHGCARNAKACAGDVLTAVRFERCHYDTCVDCQVSRFVEQLKARGSCSVAKATLEHWPVPGASGTGRTENPGPIDDMLDGTRLGTFNVAYGQLYIPKRPAPDPIPPVEVPITLDGPGPATVVDSGVGGEPADLEL